MSNEFTIGASVSVTNGNLKFVSPSVSYRANQTTANGPAPGAVTATTTGVNVSLSQLTLPGVTYVTNTDPTNYVTVGLYDGTTFRPMLELLPGDSQVFRLSRTVLTANTGADVIRLVANTASVVVQFNCFDT